MLDPCNNVNVDRAYITLNNYKLCATDPAKETLYVFCSSNGLYDNTFNSFTEAIVVNDRYEFCNSFWLTNIDGDKLFLRDVYKQWYVKGLNNKINTLEEISEFVSAISTKYKKVIFVGSSAGAYLALYLLTKNKQATAIVASPFFSLDHVGVNNRFVHEVGTHNLPKITKAAISNRSIIIIPSLSTVDIPSIMYARESGLSVVFIRSNKHGVPISKYSLHTVIRKPRLIWLMQWFKIEHFSSVVFEILFMNKKLLIKDFIKRWLQK